MKITSIFLFLLTVCQLWGFDHTEPAEHSYPDAICRHIEILASDAFEGRKPGTPGETKTIQYIKEQFEEIGLQPAAEDGTFFQKIELANFSTSAPASLELAGKKGSAQWQLKEDFVLGSQTANERFQIPETPFVFAGFGIYAPELGWDDYKNVDVSGKIVVVLSGSPDQYTEDSTLWRGDPAANLYGQNFYKKNEAAARGALGVFTIYKQKPHAFWTWESLAAKYGQNVMTIKKQPDEKQLTFDGLITREAVARLFQLAGFKDLDFQKEALQTDFQAIELPVKTTFSFTNTWKDAPTYNIAGLLPGTTRADEVILYTAHWDHVGIGPPIAGDSIRNGAVDNASGTAAIIEIARAYKSLPQPPKRSILFVATGAEEMGLLGAVWYARHPLFPLGKTVAALNMDSHFPYGKTTHVTGVVYGRSELDGYLEQAARLQNRTIIPNTEQNIAQNIFFRSDHFPLAEAGVPSEFAVGFGGVDSLAWAEKAGSYMPKYHQPSDEYSPDDDCSGIWQDAELIFLTGQLLDREDAFPMWDDDQPFQHPRRKARFESKYFTDVTRTHLPVMTLLGRSMDAKPADIDGDGDLDILIANEHNFNIVLINDGTGHFTDESHERLPLRHHDSEDIAIADFDSDGDPDIVFVSEDDQVNEYYENDGKGFFRDISYKMPVTGTSNAVIASDLNGDGHPDLLIGNAPDRQGNGGQNVCLINDGKGNWTDETVWRLPVSSKATQDLELGDVDGDGDLDLIVGNEDDNELLINDGKGFFRDETAARLPVDPGKWETREADFGDVDGDGDLDLFLANVNFRQTKDSQNRLFINDGKGFFKDETATRLPAEKMHTVDGDFCDLDDDGDLDLITGNGFGNSYKAYLNESGFFKGDPGAVIPASVRGDGIDIERADFNGDGAPDLYFCNFRGNDFLLFGNKRTDGLTVGEILHRHNEAMGGVEAWKNLRSWRIHHRRTNGTVVSTAKKPDKFRLEFKLGDKHLVKSFDGKNGWLVVDGKHEAMRPGEAIEMAEEPDFYGELIFAQLKNLPVELLGEVQLNSKKHYHLKLTKSPVDEQFYWIDASTFLISQTAEYSEDPAHEGIFYKTTFSDYRSVDGLMFPFREALIPNDGEPRSWENERVEVNVKVKDAFFEK